jgi:hypothetical protein
MDLLAILLVVFVVCFILFKFPSFNLIRFLQSNSKYLPFSNKWTKLFGICLEQLACDNLFTTVYQIHNTHHTLLHTSPNACSFAHCGICSNACFGTCDSLSCEFSSVPFSFVLFDHKL